MNSKSHKSKSKRSHKSRPRGAAPDGGEEYATGEGLGEVELVSNPAVHDNENAQGR